MAATLVAIYIYVRACDKLLLLLLFCARSEQTALFILQRLQVRHALGVKTPGKAFYIERGSTGSHTPLLIFYAKPPVPLYFAHPTANVYQSFGNCYGRTHGDIESLSYWTCTVHNLQLATCL